MLPGEGVVVVAVVLVFVVELPPVFPPEFPPLEDVEVFGLLGTITVTVTLGVVLVTLVTPLVPPDLDFVGDLPGVVLVGFVVFVGVVPGWKAAYSRVAPVPE